MKIMVVDDDEIIIEAMRNILEPEGFEVISAGSGEECLRLLEEVVPDYIFIDIQMPGMDGWETLRRIRSREELRHIPIAMLTAQPLTRETLDREDVGELVDYVVKPFTRRDIEETLKQALVPV
ncbi:MAG: response regulator [Euryarchaeota archaeon]|nr:response regulator [Euryarchaeota archaeon]